MSIVNLSKTIESVGSFMALLILVQDVPESVFKIMPTKDELLGLAEFIETTHPMLAKVAHYMASHDLSLVDVQQTLRDMMREILNETYIAVFAKNEGLTQK